MTSSASNNFVAVSHAVLQIKGVGPGKIKKGIKNLGGNVSTTDGYIDHFCRELSLTRDEICENGAVDQAFEILQSLDGECRTVAIIDDEYPEALKRLPTAPPFLVLRGAGIPFTNMIAIIGSRNPTGVTEEVSRALVDACNRHEVAICNGLARGVDSIIFDAAVESKLPFVGVMAGGIAQNLDFTLSRGMAAQSHRVLESGGVLVSEYLNPVKETPYSIIASCRLQAGVSQGLALVQSASDGGSLYAVKAAQKVSNPVGVLTGHDSVDSAAFSGNQVLLDGEHGNGGVKPLRFIQIEEDFTDFLELIKNQIESTGNNLSQPDLF